MQIWLNQSKPESVLEDDAIKEVARRAVDGAVADVAEEEEEERRAASAAAAKERMGRMRRQRVDSKRADCSTPPVREVRPRLSRTFAGTGTAKASKQRAKAGDGAQTERTPQMYLAILAHESLWPWDTL